MSKQSRSTIVTRQTGDVIEHKCEWRHCTGGTWFIPARSDARYCSGTCRVAAHRERKHIAEHQARQKARAKYEADVIEQHRRTWVGFFTGQGVTGHRATALYEEGMRADLIPKPWLEPSMF
jgi:hypothetical protein